MTRSYLPGELRLAVLGDLLRNPLSKSSPIAKRLEVADQNTVRITLGRLADKGWARKHEHGWLVTADGRAYLSQVRGWIEA